MGKAVDKSEELAELLRFVLKFHYNVGSRKILKRLFDANTPYSEREPLSGYIQSKVELIERKGFSYFFNELDLSLQTEVARMMLERYPELAKMLK